MTCDVTVSEHNVHGDSNLYTHNDVIVLCNTYCKLALLDRICDHCNSVGRHTTASHF